MPRPSPPSTIPLSPLSAQPPKSIFKAMVGWPLSTFEPFTSWLCRPLLMTSSTNAFWPSLMPATTPRKLSWSALASSSRRALVSR